MTKNTFTNRMGKTFNVEHLALNRIRLSRPYDTGEGTRIYSVEVNCTDLVEWVDGKVVQDAMPYLNADQREFLMSGLAPAEFEAMFGEYE